MARQDYMTIAVTKSTQELFREFIAAKELTVKEALSDMLEIYMIATDMDLYTALKSNRLNVEEAKNMILDRNSEVSKNNSLFMKLGQATTDDGEELNGSETIEIYEAHCNRNGFTWYSTNSLKNGMKREKAKSYNDLAQAGHLKIYFAMNDHQVNNDIAYVADVMEVISYEVPTIAPCDAGEYPEEFQNCKNNIWIKVQNLHKEETLHAEDFVVASTGNNLKQVITKGQYIFGYIKRM